MSAYAAIESIVVAVLALVSVFYVLKVMIPGPMHSMRMRIAELLLSRNAGHDSPLSSLAARLRLDGQSGGCASGCESGGCNGCSVATRAETVRSRRR